MTSVFANSKSKIQFKDPTTVENLFVFSLSMDGLQKVQRHLCLLGKRHLCLLGQRHLCLFFVITRGPSTLWSGAGDSDSGYLF